MNSLYKDYEALLIKSDKLSKENSDLRYYQKLLKAQVETLKKNKIKNQQELKNKDEIIKEKDYEIARLKALLNIDGTNSGIPTSQTPINKKKVIPNTREKTEKKRGGQNGHKKHKLEKFNEDEITEKIEHELEKCPCCKNEEIEETGEIKKKRKPLKRKQEK